VIIQNLIFSGVGGALGAVARGYLGRIIVTRFPWATLVVNVVGSFLAGVLISIFAGNTYSFFHDMELLSLGFCGGFTTFSSFSFQTMELIRNGRRKMAALNITLSLLLSIGAAWLGIIIFK